MEKERAGRENGRSMTFQIGLAGRTVAISPLYERVREICEDYILRETARGEPDITVITTGEDIAREEEAAWLEDRRRGTVSRFSPEQLEITAVYRKIATAMPAYNTFVMHGSLVSTEGQGYLIAAPSGVGKTTRTKLWTENIPDSFTVNGDKPLLQVTDDGVTAFGTPWCGKERWNRNTSVPLRAVFLLERSEKGNAVFRISCAEAFPRLLQQSFRPSDPDARRRTLLLLQAMAGKVGIFQFRSEPTAEAVRMAWEAARPEKGRTAGAFHG